MKVKVRGKKRVKETEKTIDSTKEKVKRTKELRTSEQRWELSVKIQLQRDKHGQSYNVVELVGAGVKVALHALLGRPKWLKLALVFFLLTGFLTFWTRPSVFVRLTGHDGSAIMKNISPLMGSRGTMVAEG